MKRFISFLIFLAILSCDHQPKTDHKKTDHKVFPQKQASTTTPKAEKVIQILPLGDVRIEYINEIKSAVKKFYGYDCVVLQRVEPTSDILARSKKRYDADKILEKYNSKEYRIIITEKDIATENEARKSKEWGIFGMGYWPGTTCVVSTERLRKKGGKLVPHELFMERLGKIALHEIGHNLGLDHCKNDPRCMMNDAKGTIEQVDRERIWFCDRCTKQLH